MSQSVDRFPEFRIGIGYDSHQFAPGGPLILGGTRIPVDFSLSGHSDGDAVAHAVTDAILGAAALGDIGALFPDSDPRNRGADSLEMLRAAVRLLHDHGFRAGNADVVIIAEKPVIAPWRDQIRSALANALETSVAQVSVKGKTNERMGWVGRGEGLACLATAAIWRMPDPGGDGTR